MVFGTLSLGGVTTELRLPRGSALEAGGVRSTRLLLGGITFILELRAEARADAPLTVRLKAVSQAALLYWV